MNHAKPYRLLNLLGIIAIACLVAALFMRHEAADTALARVELYIVALKTSNATAAELHRSLGERPVSAEQKKLFDELRRKVNDLAILEQEIADLIKASKTGAPEAGESDEAKTKRVLYDILGGDAVKMWDAVALISGALGIAFLVAGFSLTWVIHRRATSKF